MSDLKPYTSGYMKPPKHGQFKPGKSGNQKGRPKQPPTSYAALRKALKRKVKVKGEEKMIRLDEALIFRLRDLALSGDRRAIAMQRRILEMSGVGILEQREDFDLLAAKEAFPAFLSEDAKAELAKDGIDD